MRNRFELDGFVLEKLEDPDTIEAFDCGDDDLNEYFHKDCKNYAKELLTQTYCFHRVSDSQCESLALVDFCNDALSRDLLGNKSKRNINHRKRGYRAFPAVKITRLGVEKSAHGMRVGQCLIQAIKHFFLTDNRCGCRFITVDAYACAKGFYEKCGFVISKGEDTGKTSGTLSMFYDLKQLSL